MVVSSVWIEVLCYFKIVSFGISYYGFLWVKSILYKNLKLQDMIRAWAFYTYHKSVLIIRALLTPSCYGNNPYLPQFVASGNSLFSIPQRDLSYGSLLMKGRVGVLIFQG
jgi:hypothetical protein